MQLALPQHSSKPGGGCLPISNGELYVQIEKNKIDTIPIIKALLKSDQKAVPGFVLGRDYFAKLFEPDWHLHRPISGAENSESQSYWFYMMHAWN